MQRAGKGEVRTEPRAQGFPLEEEGVRGGEARGGRDGRGLGRKRKEKGGRRGDGRGGMEEGEEEEEGGLIEFQSWQTDSYFHCL